MLNSGKRLIVTAIAISLIGIVAGLLIENSLLPSKGSEHQNAEKILSSKTETMVVEHSHDDLPMHKHIIQAVITTTETTPHGDFHDFGQGMPSDITPMPTNPGPIQTTPNVTQTMPATTTKYEVWLYYNDVMPPSITVPVGATVTWTNMDNQEHTVNFDNIDFNVRLVARSTTASYTFNETGIFTYHCDPHPNLKGDVIVK